MKIAECPKMVAIGFMPRFTASLFRINTSAAAPSEMELELAAVIVPFSLNTDFNTGIFSGFALVGNSSDSIILSLAVMGAISKSI